MAARRGRPRKFRDKGGPLYEENTPIDEATGAPPDEALIPDEDARNMAMDAESSRRNAQHQQVIRNKQQGVPMTQWSKDYRIKYGEIYRFHPGAKVVIKMIEPYDDDNIPTRYLAQLNNYDKLIQHIKDTHWQGKQAAYQWAIMEDGGRTWGIGVIKLGPQREESAAHAHVQQQQQYPMSPPQWYGQQWGYPPPQQQLYPQQPMYQQGPQYPQQQFVEPPQQVAAPQPPQPPQPQYAPHPDVLTGLLSHIERLTNTVIEQKVQGPNFVQAPPQQAPPPPVAPPGYMPQIPWHMMSQLPPAIVQQIPPHLLPYVFGNGFVPAPQQSQQPQQQTPPQRAESPQAPPLSPIDAAREAMAGVKEMMRMGREFAQFANPEAPDDPESPAAPPPDPDPTPLQVQDIGFKRFVRNRDTGEMVESQGIDSILMSGDKVGALLGVGVEKVIGVIEKRQQMQTEHELHQLDRAKQLSSVQREIAESQERIARAKAIQAAAETSMRSSQAPVAPAQAQPQFAYPVPQPQQNFAPPPAPPPPQHFAPTSVPPQPQQQFVQAAPTHFSGNGGIASHAPPSAPPPTPVQSPWAAEVAEDKVVVVTRNDPPAKVEPEPEAEEPTAPPVARPIMVVRNYAPLPTPEQKENGVEEKTETEEPTQAGAP